MCPGCGLGRTIRTTVSVKDQDYLDPAEIGGSLRPQYFRDLYNDYFSDCVPGRSLDIGCGRGEWVRVLETHGWIAHGIDSYNNFEPDGVRFFRSSLVEFEPTYSYDLITLVHCFEHLGDPVASLDKIAQMLVPGGQLLIVVPNFGGVWSAILKERWHMLKPEHHCYHYTLKSLRRILECSSFNVSAIRTYSGYAPSLLQLLVAKTHLDQRGIGSIQPIRSIVFRANTMLRPLINKLTDRRLEGAEIQILARVAQRR
jgi:SAM-dependent methyltransferase